MTDDIVLPRLGQRLRLEHDYLLSDGPVEGKVTRLGTDYFSLQQDDGRSFYVPADVWLEAVRAGRSEEIVVIEPDISGFERGYL